MEPISLARRISLPGLVLYGLGTTVGAGMYALVGEVAGRAGHHVPISFALSAVLAGFTALSFAELSSRFPKSAGEAEYVRQGFGSRGFALAIGLMVVAAGSISAAAVSVGFAGYLGQIVAVPGEVAIGVLLLGLGAIAARGVRETFLAAGLITLIEVGGLLLVAFAARAGLGSALPGLFDPGAVSGVGMGIVGGAALAFFAFLGFEDMVNVAEEVRDAPRVLPRAIGWTLVLTTALYIVTATAAVTTVPPDVLARSDAPLALVWHEATGRSAKELGGIGALAMVNGALVQIVMASRILYGLARQGVLPESLGRVHPRTRTPVRAVALVTTGVAILALTFPLGALAEVTSLLALCVFAAVNAALWRIRRSPDDVPAAYRCPPGVPAAGFATSAALVVLELARLLGAR